MFNWLVNRLIARAKRTPYVHLEGYMERYWLIPYSRWFPAVRIHHILRSDDNRAFHDHPWAYLSIILRGGYTEVTPYFEAADEPGKVRYLKYYPAGSILFRKAKSFHRLQVAEGQTAWTLFITFKWQQVWGFLPYKDGVKIPYREYLGLDQ